MSSRKISKKKVVHKHAKSDKKVKGSDRIEDKDNWVQMQQMPEVGGI